MINGTKEASLYYDTYSKRYDGVRENPYHYLISELTKDFLLRFVRAGDKVLDLGCGTGINLNWLKDFGARVFGMDLSFEMLRRSKEKGHPVSRGHALQLPFRSASLDVVYSFKVLAHVSPIESAIEEIFRVLKPGGTAILEFYNPVSLRGLIKLGFKPRLRVAEALTERDIYTRFDSPGKIRALLNACSEQVADRGVITFVPVAGAYRIRFLFPVLRFLERVACDGFLKRFGGFYITAVRKKLS